MKFNDQGIIINSKDYGENSAVLKILSEDHGICKAFVRQAKSKRLKAILQIGNIVSFSYSTRLEENLGSFSHIDLIVGNSTFMFNSLKLNCVQSIFSMIDELFLERDSCPILFNSVSEFLFEINNSSQKITDIIAKYIKLELLILQILGYGIDLSSCVVTNSDIDLKFVSPKSARAVCFEAGKAYQDKLLKLPEFIINDDANFAEENLIDGLKLSGYFLEKFFFNNFTNKKLFFRNNIKKSLELEYQATKPLADIDFVAK